MDNMIKHEDILEMLKLIGDNPAFPTDIRYHAFEVFSYVKMDKHKPAEPLIVKSGETWVRYANGINSICLNPRGEKVMHLYRSFTGPNPDITELTDEIAKLRPMVTSEHSVHPLILWGVKDNNAIFLSNGGKTINYFHLATAHELQESV